MQRLFGKRYRSVLAVAGVIAAGSAMGVAPPAGAEQRGAALANLRLTYATPETLSNNHIVWRWTIENLGPSHALAVKVVHRLDPGVRATYVSSPCVAAATTVTCTYGTLTPGARQGVMDTVVSQGLAAGPVSINGQVSWVHG